jgi:hypothetical protein
MRSKIIHLLFIGLTISFHAKALDTEFKWFPNDYDYEGSCYLVDVKTNGDIVKEYASSSDCKPAKTVYVLNGGQCYEVAEKDGRDSYSVRTDIFKCIP